MKQEHLVHFESMDLAGKLKRHFWYDQLAEKGIQLQNGMAYKEGELLTENSFCPELEELRQLVIQRKRELFEKYGVWMFFGCEYD